MNNSTLLLFYICIVSVFCIRKANTYQVLLFFICYGSCHQELWKNIYLKLSYMVLRIRNANLFTSCGRLKMAIYFWLSSHETWGYVPPPWIWAGSVTALMNRKWQKWYLPVFAPRLWEIDSFYFLERDYSWPFQGLANISKPCECTILRVQSSGAFRWIQPLSNHNCLKEPRENQPAEPGSPQNNEREQWTVLSHCIFEWFVTPLCAK